LNNAIAVVDQVVLNKENDAIIKKMADYKKELFLAVNNIDSNNQNVKDLSAKLSEKKIELSKLVKDLANGNAAFTVEKANYDAKNLLYDAAVKVRNDAQSDYYSKLSAQKVAHANNGGKVDVNGNEIAPVNIVGPLYDEYVAKKALATLSLAVFEAKNTLATNALDIMELAYGVFKSTAKYVSDREGDIKTQRDLITDDEKLLLTAQNAIPVSSDKATYYTKAIADLTPSFDKAILDGNKVFEVKEAKQKIVDAIQAQIDVLNVTLTENGKLITSLEISKNLYNVDLVQEIKDKKDEIKKTNSALDELEVTASEIKSGSITQAKEIATVIKQIAEDKQLLATLTIKIAATERQAKYWKDLLDKIFTV